MSWTAARPIDKAASTTFKVSAALVQRKYGLTFSLSFGASAQQQLFGRQIEGEGVRIDVGRGDDHGRIRVTLDQKAPAASAGPRGSARVTVMAWDLLGKEPKPGAALTFGSSGPEGVILNLPSWGQPADRRAALDKEFGLKPIGRTRDE